MKKSLFALLATVSTLSLAACSSNDAETTGSESADKTVVRFSSWDNEESLTFQQELVDEFNESQDEIEVKLEAYGNDYDTKITAGMGAGDAPDVMYMWNYPLYHEGLEPLDSYIESEGEGYKENFYETTWNYNSIDDTVYGIPVGFTTHVLFYNKDLFDAAGVAYPTSDWTWSDLHQASKELSDPSNNVYGYVLPMQPDPYDFEMYLWSNGASYTNDEGELAGNLDSDESVEVFTTFQEMLKDQTAIASEDSGTDEMSAGTAAMLISGAWSIETFNDAGINYGTVEIPSFEGKESVSILSSSGLGMSADSENKEAAWEFIKFWTNENANKVRIDYELPVLKNVVAEEGLEDDEVKSVFYNMLERSDSYAPTSFKVDTWSTLSEDLNLVFEEIFNPTTQMEPKEALEAVIK